MKNEPKLDVLNSKSWQVLIELARSGIVLQKQELVHPVQNEIENASKWVQKWQTNRICHDAEKVCVVLGIYIVA